ncbi:MAG: DUF177 domain-containing protein [Nitrospiraceae bacterium]|nr:DUF177 domain-containing protein [Nitrospiraceae bacterium]
MKITISEIPAEGLEFDINEKLELDDVKLLSPVTGRLSIKKMGGELVIHGNAETKAELECSRCLKHYTAHIEADIDAVYHPLRELSVEGIHEVREDELDLDFYRGDELDVLDLINEQVFLNTPMKSLCDEACKGICQICGKDLNTESCNCAVSKADPRLEVLKKLLPEESKE